MAVVNPPPYIINVNENCRMLFFFFFLALKNQFTSCQRLFRIHLADALIKPIHIQFMPLTDSQPDPISTPRRVIHLKAIPM